jgi:hypothetical protein
VTVDGPSLLDGLASSAFANRSSRFPRLEGLSIPAPELEGRFSSCGLCLEILAFVGDAKDGYRGVVWAPSFRIGMRLGVAGASIGMDVVGDVLRRLAGESAIDDLGSNYRLSIIKTAKHTFVVVMWSRRVGKKVVESVVEGINRVGRRTRLGLSNSLGHDSMFTTESKTKLVRNKSIDCILSLSIFII